MDVLKLIIIVFAAVAAISSLIALFVWVKIRTQDPADPQSSRPIPDVDKDVEIPDADQEYLAPLLSKTLKHLAASKRAFPTNAMLIDHLGETLGYAGATFDRRTKDNPDVQKKNEAWLSVAAMAIRLYDEGTPHNSDNTREQFIVLSKLSERELNQWARQVNNEIAASVKKKMKIPSRPAPVAVHAETIAGSPYTADEIEDLKQARMRLMKKGKSK